MFTDLYNTHSSYLFNKPWHFISTITEFYITELHGDIPLFFFEFTHMAKLIFIVVLV